MATIEVDPISRIEGHLGVKVTTDVTGKITEADAHGNLWRGFENFLIGRRANDAITFTQRICGVCPVPHGTASTFAADSVLGVSKGYATFKWNGVVGTEGVPEAGLHVRNMILASEFLMSSITHFYHLVAQDYVQGPPIPPWTPYFRTADYASQLLLPEGRKVPLKNVNGDPNFGTYPGLSKKLWDAVITQYVKALRIRRLTFEAGAMFAGRMPMVSALVAGGTTNTFESAQELRDKLDVFRALMTEVGDFVVKEYIPLALALGALYPKDDNKNNTALGGNGAGLGNFLAWGGFPQADVGETMAVKGGWVIDAAGAAVKGVLLESKAGGVGGVGGLDDAIAKVQANITESIARSHYTASYGYTDKATAEYPGDITMTEPDRTSGYSWMKAPRWDGYAMEVGPFARMVVNGKYPATNTNVVTDGYADIYVKAGALDAAVLSPDLVSGLAGDGLVGTVAGYIAGMKGGLSTLDRIRARALESYWMVTYLIGAPSKDPETSAISWPDATSGAGWAGALRTMAASTVPKFYRDTTAPVGEVHGFGLVEAPRGALGHFVTATGGKIKSYQCVVPTTWNGSPKNGTAATSALYEAKKHLNDGPNRGAIEQATIDVVYNDTPMNGSDPHTIAGAQSGVEVMRVAHSFDPCIACAVH
jgi:hydrogenase large subunit